MAQITRLGALTGMVAAVSMATTPAYAADMFPAADQPTGSAFGIDFSEMDASDQEWFDPAAETAEYRRRWRGRRYRRGIRGRDIFAGVLVLGGIAAIASAANNNRRRDRDVVIVERERVRDDRRYENRRSNPRSSNGSGLDNAVSICLDEIERDVRVDSVDNASRTPSGWSVSGTLFNGSAFNCRIDNNGRVSGVDYGGFSGVNYGTSEIRSEPVQAPGQWSDARYNEARALTPRQEPNGTQTQVVYVDSDLQPLNASTAGDARPAYPGGPLPGEEGYPDQ